MGKRYDEVMEKIEVTDDMRRRILANIDQMDLKAAPRARVLRFPGLKRLVPLAACFVLLVAGTLSARYFLPGERVDPQPTEGVMIGSGIVEAADAAKLSEAVGFPVKELSSLPFRAEKVTYTSYWEELAEITYEGEGQAVSLRQSAGEGDNSGDYNVYAKTEVKELGGQSVTLKGDGQNYVLAIWNDGEYAYSIRTAPGFTALEWETLLADFA